MNWVGSASLKRSSRRSAKPRRAQLARGEVERDVGPQALRAPGGGLRDHGVDDPVADRLDQPAVLGGGDELAGRDHPALRVVPAQQRLDGDGGAAGDLEDRLVVQLELAAGQRPAQAGGERQLAGGAGVLAGGEADRSAAVALGLVERGVGALEQVRHVVAVGGEQSRRRCWPRSRTRGLRSSNGALERRQHVVGDAAGRRAGVAVEVGEQEHELVAAVAGEQVGGAAAAGEARGDLAQQLVARGVAERVVDDLEVVEVDVEHRGGEVVAAGARRARASRAPRAWSRLARPVSASW